MREANSTLASQSVRTRLSSSRRPTADNAYLCRDEMMVFVKQLNLVALPKLPGRPVAAGGDSVLSIICKCASVWSHNTPAPISPLPSPILPSAIFHWTFHGKITDRATKREFRLHIFSLLPNTLLMPLTLVRFLAAIIIFNFIPDRTESLID